MEIPKTKPEVVPRRSKAPEIIFANWREMLNQQRMRPQARRDYAQAIESYLEYCRHNGVSVGVETARGFMADALRRGLTREGERWKAGNAEKPESGKRESGKRETGWVRGKGPITRTRTRTRTKRASRSPRRDGARAGASG